MKRFHSFVPLILVTVCCPFTAAADNSRPNILLIFSDDHAKRAISCYGNKDIQTPALDRLAAEGMRFEHALTPNSFCTPARAAVLTGKYSHKNGVTHLNQKFDGSQQTFPKLLRAAGYETALFGKWHLLSQPTGFDHYCIMKMQGMPFNPRVFEPHHKWIAWGPKTRKEALQQGGRIIEGYNNDVITNEAINWLKRRRKSSSDPKPFCLLIHPKPPHAPYTPPKKYEDFLKDVTIPEPATLLDDYKGRAPEAIADLMTANRIILRPEYTKMIVREPELQKMSREELTRHFYQIYIKGYYRLVKSVDDNVGRVLDYLDESGLTKSTLVIYSSDQGFALGEHGFYNKQWMYEPSLHQPLILRYPGVVRAGSVHQSMVNHVDIAPTLLDLAGLPIPSDMQGYSLKPILEGKADKVRDASYYHFYEHGKRLPEMIGIRTATHKLIYYPGLPGTHQWELFDLRHDPDEMKNLYRSPANQKLRRRLKRELQALAKRYEDPVKIPQDRGGEDARRSDASTKHEATALLIEAARSGDLKAVNMALASGVSPNGPAGRLTALHWAVARRIAAGKTIEPSAEIAKRLIEAGAEVNAKDYLGQTPLEWAAKYASPDVVETLIKAGADVNAESVYGTVLIAGARIEIAELLVKAGADVNAGKFMTPLASAAKYGNVALIRFLIENKARVKDPRNPPIHWVGKPEVAKTLVDAGADVNQRNDKGETVLHLPHGVWIPTPETVKLLIEAGADVNTKSRTGSTPLHSATRQGKPEIARLLVASGANVDAKDQEGNTPLSSAQATLAWARGSDGVDETPYESMIKLLIEAGAKDDGRTELQRAVAERKLGDVKRLIASAVDVNAPGPQRITAVHIASEKGYAKILGALIDAGANVDGPNARGMRPLHLAANAEIARALIAKGARINSASPSPLYMATANDKADVVRELIRNNANVKDSDCAAMLNWATFFGRIEVVRVLFELRDAKTLLKALAVYSPLHIAASGTFGDMNCPNHVTPEQRLQIAKLLVSKGANVDAKWGANVNPRSGAAHMINTTPLMFASSMGNSEMVEFLIEQRANVKAANASGQTALHFAAMRGHRRIVAMLIEARATLNPLTREGKTPLDVAQDEEVKALLIQNGGKTASEVLNDSSMPRNSKVNRKVK